MRTIKQFISIVILLSIAISGNSQGYHKRIGFVGNSITAGTFLANAATQSYPAQFAALLSQVYGDTCIVSNYAVSGRTMLKQGDYPIWNESLFKQGYQSAPDIVFIMLGTNDSKPQNWIPYHNDFFGDYVSMIDTFQKRNPRTKFIIALPPPAFAVNYSIRPSVVTDSVIPLIDSVAKVKGIDTIDFYHPLLDSVYLFPDNIHPNVKGAGVMAKMVFNKFMSLDIIHKVDTGYTTVTSFNSNSTFVKETDSATLSWTSINADTAYFEGQIVPVNGSIKVNAGTTTTYTVIAKGKLSSDSLKLTQIFYHPELAKITISPGTTTRHAGDSVFYSISNFMDQYNNLFHDTVFAVEWSITDGTGKLVNATSTSVTFVATDTGSIKVVAKVGSIISNTSKITVMPLTYIKTNENAGNKVQVFPNPIRETLNVSITTSSSASSSIKIYDLKGTLILEEYNNLSGQGERVFSINTKGLQTGIYLYKVAFAGEQFTGKFEVKK